MNLSLKFASRIIVAALRPATLLCLLGTATVFGAADPDARVGFSIQPQTLATALIEFSKQTRIQVMSSGIDLGRRRSPGVSGTHSISQALRTLLSGSGLEFSFTGPNTIAIRSATPVSSAAGEEPMRLAQVDADTPARPAEPPQQASVPEDQRGVPELLVKGRRTVNSDIQRSEDDAQPYVVFGRKEIQTSQATSLEEFFRNRLPMNAVQASNSQRQFSGNESSVALRGLSADQTLILVDGRRMPSVNLGGGGLGQPDINGIPLAAIERIEVLPSTASGIHGGGATGGVINIITRQDYAGSEFTVTYGNSFASDVASRRIDGTMGFTLEEGRTQVRILASHADANPLLVGERDFTARGRALQLRNSPADFVSAALSTATTLPLGYTPNIRNASPNQNANLVLKPAYGGASLGYSFTSIPVGYAGLGASGVAGLVNNAGRYNLDLPDDLNGARQSLLNNPTVRSAALNLRRSLGASVEVFTDFSWLENCGRSLMSNVAGGVTLPASAPNNPFTTAINVRFPSTGIESPFRSDSQTLRAMGGVLARLPAGWTAAADFVWSRSRRTVVQSRPVLGDPDGAGPGLPITAVLANGTLDVMRDLNRYPVDYAPYRMPEGNSVFGPLDTLMRDAIARVSGPVWRMPGGPLRLSASVGQRREKTSHGFEDVQSATTAMTTVNWVPGASQEVSSWTLEATAPFFSGANALRFVRSLELQASVRRDDYRTRAPTPGSASLPSRSSPLPVLTYSTNAVASADYTVGLRFSPLEDVMLRASMGSGFLPADIHQIASSPAQSGSVTVADPKRGGIRASTGLILLDLSGNPDLLPEESRSESAGLVITPRFVPGLRLSADYTRIRKTNEISSLGFQALLNFEDLFPGAVTRAPLEPNAPAGYTAGRILSLDLTPRNFARTRLDAWDFQADYQLRTAGAGDLQLFALATWQTGFERQGVPNADYLDSVGYAGGLLKWRGNAGINWDRGAWSASWSTQLFDSYYVYAAGSAAATITAMSLAQGSGRIPRQVYHDVFVRYAFGNSSMAGGLLADAEVSLGIQNILDKQPPILATTSSVGGYSTYGDPRLRRYSITLKKGFGR